MRTELGEKFKVEARVITPVHIGGDDVLSPLTDYVLNDTRSEISIIDTDELVAKISDAGCLDDFARDIEDVADTNKQHFIEDKLEKYCKLQLHDIGVLYRLNAYGIAGNPTEIKCFKRQNGNPFVPASSLKGAFRTAILYQWLKDTSEYGGADLLKRWLKNLVNRPKEINLHKHHKNMEREYAFLEQRLFGKTGEKVPMADFSIPDSQSLAQNNLAIYQSGRYSFRHEDIGFRGMYECLKPNEAFHTEIQLKFDRLADDKNKPGEKFFKYQRLIFQLKNPGELVHIINLHSLDLINYDLEVMNGEDIDKEGFERYFAQLNELKSKVEKGGNEIALLRLGSGKMQFYQTIALAIFRMLGSDESNADWLQYLEYVPPKNKDLKSLFPISRVLTIPSQIPLGWIQLTIQ